MRSPRRMIRYADPPIVLGVLVAVVMSACGAGQGGVQTIGFDTGSGCDLTEATSQFSTLEPVHYRASFQPDLQTGDDITVTVSHDGEAHPGLSSVLTLAEPTDCIHARLGYLDPGEYSVVVASRIGTGMPPVSGNFEVSGEALARPPVGEVWFGSSYDPDTYEVRGRTDSVEVGDLLAFVTHLESEIASDELMLRLSHDGDVLQHDRVDVPGNEGSRRYGFDGPAPPEPGKWTFDFTDIDGNVLATGEIEVIASLANSASPDPSDDPSAEPSEATDGAKVTTFDIEAGDCFISNGEHLETVTVVDCDQPHVYEAFHVFDHEAGSTAKYPGDDEIYAYAEETCDPAFVAFVDHDYETSLWYITTVTPSSESWAVGDRKILCALSTENLDEVTGSAENAGE